MDAQAVETRRRCGEGGLVKRSFRKILVIQTAFIGDAILTLPLIQVLKRTNPGSIIDVVVVPRSAELFHNHPAISTIIEYDKRGQDRGLGRFLSLLGQLRQSSYDLAVIPHRSLRSALLAALTGVPIRVGFDTSAGRLLFTRSARYRKEIHEIERNLSLLAPIEISFQGRELPKVYPSSEDIIAVDEILRKDAIDPERKMIALAPGTIWNTKRWLKERFTELGSLCVENGCSVVLIGGPEDRPLCKEIHESIRHHSVANVCGRLSLLQSAALLKRCRALVSNDSAPMHLAVAMGTPVVAIFGATVPAFGFAPYGEKDIVIETLGLSCRPCSIHGGEKCPIETFECMKNISSQRVYRDVERLLQ